MSARAPATSRWRLARAVPAGEVIATDVEPDMVRYLNERARREKLANLRAVQSTRTGSGLAAASVDRILVVHGWHHLDDRERHARELAAALRPGGNLMIVDFSLAGHRGPPAHVRVPPEVVVAELASAGAQRERLARGALPDQYIVEGAASRERSGRYMALGEGGGVLRSRGGRGWGDSRCREHGLGPRPSEPGRPRARVSFF